jgi:MoxR-like ATPase
MRLRIGYPPESVERQVIARRRKVDPVADLSAVADKRDLLSAQAAVDRVRVNEEVIDYLHGLILATRTSPLLSIGASTRAAIALERAVRALALTEGRNYTTPDDVKAVGVSVLAHRVRPAGSRDGGPAHVDGERIVRDLLAVLPVPV